MQKKSWNIINITEMRIGGTSYFSYCFFWFWGEIWAEHVPYKFPDIHLVFHFFIFLFFYTCETQAGAGVESCGAWFMITRMCMQTHAVHNSLHTHSTCCSAVGRSVIHRSHLSPSINHPSIIIIITSITTVGFIVAIMIITVPAVTRLVCALLWLSPALWHALFSLTAVWLHRSASVFLGPQVKTGPPTPLLLLPPRGDVWRLISHNDLALSLFLSYYFFLSNNLLVSIILTKWLDLSLKGSSDAKFTFTCCLNINVCWQCVNTSTL